MSKFKEGIKINGHKVLSYDGKDKIQIICGTCGAYAFKTRKRIYDSIGCSYCKIRSDGFTKYKKEYYSYVYQIPMNTIDSRLKRGKTFKQAIGLEPLKIPEENFSEKDLLYISDFNSKNFNNDKEIADRAYLKFKTNFKINE